MFGLFGKKKQRGAEQPAAQDPAIPSGPPPSPPLGPPPRPAGPVITGVADWRALCQQQRELLDNEVRAVLEACRDEIAATQIDTSWIDRRFLPIDRKTEAARNLVRSTWNRTGDFEGEKLALELDLAELEITLVREHGHRYVRAHAARAMMVYALDQDARTRSCAGCGTFMPTLRVSQAHQVECSSCHRAQVVEPGQAFRVFASCAARWVGEWDGFPQYVSVRRLETEIDSYRDKTGVPLELLRSYHRASEQYWSTVLVVEGQLVPERQPHMPMQLQALMTDANRRLSGFWQWREQ